MANQNLSQFGEKLFVADADYTFIWDSAASISKRVSRNSWLSGTTADFHLGLADAALPVAQTISVQSVVAGTSNTAGANFSINGSQGTGTGAGGALLLRTAPAGISGTAQNALVTAVAITAAGNVGIGTTVPSTLLEVALPSTGNTLYQGIKVSRGTGYFSLGNGTGTTPNNFVGLFLGKGGISGTAAALGFQAIAGSDSDTSTSVAFFNVRNTTDNGNILDSQIAYQFRNYLTNLITVLGSGNVGIGTTSPTSRLHVALNPAADYTTETVRFGNIHFANGTGGYSNLWMGSISTPLTLSASNYTLANDGTNTIINGGSGGLYFHVGAAAHWNIQSTGHLLCASDNSRDIGAVNSQRPRNIYVGSDVISRPSASITPANNGQLVVEATSNTTLTFKLKGTDGTVRTGTITLA